MASREERKKVRAKQARAKKMRESEEQTQTPDPKPDQMREFPANYWQETPLGKQQEDVEAITGQQMSVTPRSQFLSSRRNLNKRIDQSVR